MHNILVIPDIHAPFQVSGIIPFLKKQIKKHKINKVVFSGDLLDFYILSQYAKHPEAMIIQQELDASKSFIKELAKLIPDALVCVGNHEQRLAKCAAEANFTKSFVADLPQLLETPKGWKFADSFTIDNILFYHGDGSSGRQAAFKLLERYRRNVVIGHLHGQASIVYLNNGTTTNWACVSGCLVDVNSYAMAYSKHCGDKPVIGVTVIIKGVPQFVPMPL